MEKYVDDVERLRAILSSVKRAKPVVILDGDETSYDTFRMGLYLNGQRVLKDADEVIAKNRDNGPTEPQRAVKAKERFQAMRRKSEDTSVDTWSQYTPLIQSLVDPRKLEEVNNDYKIKLATVNTHKTHKHIRNWSKIVHPNVKMTVRSVKSPIHKLKMDADIVIDDNSVLAMHMKDHGVKPKALIIPMAISNGGAVRVPYDNVFVVPNTNAALELLSVAMRVPQAQPKKQLVVA